MMHGSKSNPKLSPLGILSISLLDLPQRNSSHKKSPKSDARSGNSKLNLA
jgi:hypothetical protein